MSKVQCPKGSLPLLYGSSGIMCGITLQRAMLDGIRYRISYVVSTEGPCGLCTHRDGCERRLLRWLGVCVCVCKTESDVGVMDNLS